MSKSTVEEIRARFDQDVERFSNLQTGQSATIDAPLVLDLITSSAAAVTPQASAILDVGCGAGNYSIKMLQKLPGLAVTLIDLSGPMLDSALKRVGTAGAKSVSTLLGDIREIALPDAAFDIILAAAVLHHLRTDNEWTAVFAKFYRALRPGGSIWISDLVEQSTPAIQTLMWQRYGDYLKNLKDAAYRDHVLDYVEREDTPKPLLYQLDLLKRTGFENVEVLHKNGPFAAFGAIKPLRT
jgi:tRNA (cmo5U34)-methyltransferase